jgi:hypothetical protein
MMLHRVMTNLGSHTIENSGLAVTDDTDSAIENSIESTYLL